MNDQDRRSMPLFSISIVKKLTELTARQIRYYEEQGLIHPERTKGNQRVFSFNDVDRLLEIKKMLDAGINLAGIKELLDRKEEKLRLEAANPSVLSDKKLRGMLRNELNDVGRLGKSTLRQGELSRFFKK